LLVVRVTFNPQSDADVPQLVDFLAFEPCVQILGDCINSSAANDILVVGMRRLEGPHHVVFHGQVWDVVLHRRMLVDQLIKLDELDIKMSSIRCEVDLDVELQRAFLCSFVDKHWESNHPEHKAVLFGRQQCEGDGHVLLDCTVPQLTDCLIGQVTQPEF